MKEIDDNRKEIEEIDRQMAELFEKRMLAAGNIAAYKKEMGLPIRDFARESALLEKNRKYIASPEIEDYYVRFLQNTISVSCDYQEMLNEGMKTAYCGVEGAFAYIAAKKMFPTSRLLPCPDFAEAYAGVEKGIYDCAVLPLENSYAGEVGNVMDLIFSGELFINRVVELPVRHCLIAKKGVRTQDIKKVISHPQALNQCADYIRDHGFETEGATNTAAAAKYILECPDPSVAAIASEDTAEIFGLAALEKGINDADNNTTRFAAVSRVRHVPDAVKLRENENFILVFTVQNKAGALAQTLNIIGAHGYNMRSLRSHPMKGLQWNYYFYIEAEGNIDNENGRSMLRELSAICARLKLVGTFTAEDNHDI